MGFAATGSVKPNHDRKKKQNEQGEAGNEDKKRPPLDPDKSSEKSEET